MKQPQIVQAVQSGAGFVSLSGFVTAAAAAAATIYCLSKNDEGEKRGNVLVAKIKSKIPCCKKAEACECECEEAAEAVEEAVEAVEEVAEEATEA